jgi:hypothetical protein
MQTPRAHPAAALRDDRSRSHPPAVNANPITTAANRPAGGPPPAGGSDPAARTATPDDGFRTRDGVEGGCAVEGMCVAVAGDRVVVLAGGPDEAAGAGTLALDDRGSGERSVGGHTSAAVVGGGRSWVDPVSPAPQTHPSTSPSPTLLSPGPVEDHDHPPLPSPRQYPQKAG